ncbi:MAG: hypothetical protein AB7P49_13275 [Bdellovibrionales bacterium]
MFWTMVGIASSAWMDITTFLSWLLSAMYVSAYGGHGWFASETMSLRLLTLSGVIWVVGCVLVALGIGAHRAVQTLLTPDRVHHSGLVMFFFPASITKDGLLQFDMMARLASMVTYMLIYPVVGLLASVLSPILLFMFILNFGYVAVRWGLQRMNRLESEPLPVSTVPIVGTVFYLLNLMFSSILKKRKPFELAVQEE